MTWKWRHPEIISLPATSGTSGVPVTLATPQNMFTTWRTSKDRRKEEKGASCGKCTYRMLQTLWKPMFDIYIRTFSFRDREVRTNSLHSPMAYSGKKHCASRQNFAVPNGWPKVRPVDRWHLWRFGGWYGKHTATGLSKVVDEASLINSFLRTWKFKLKTMPISWHKSNDDQACMHDTVDGRNPANQLRLAVYPIIYEFLTSQVLQDFLHQQYLPILLSSSFWLSSERWKNFETEETTTVTGHS